MGTPELPLEGLNVVDCSTLYAGPIVAMNMGDFGADVVKIEHPEIGDPLRSYGEYEEELNWKAYGRNKESVPIDLHEERGQELFRELVADADVLIENFRPGTLENWGIGWETLSELNPDLVMVRVTGFGQTGPYSERPGFGTVAECMSGFTYITGEPDGPPMLTQMAPADKVTGLFATFATMFALYWRDVHDGHGQYIDISLVESLFGLMNEIALDYDAKGIVAERIGNQPTYGTVRGVYRTGDDRWVGVVAATRRTVERILRILGGDELANDPRFRTREARLAHVDELDEVIRDWIGERTREEVIDAFVEHDAPAAPVYNIADIFEDEHFAARGALVGVEDEELGELRMVDVVPKLSETPGRIDHPGPELGADTASVLLENTSASADEIEDLVERGVVATKDE
ncbi:MAG: CaiB/BaiF CoA transferase family protein [Halolamina sp.]